MTELNYEKEVEKLKEKKEWLKLVQGKHEIKIIEVGNDFSSTYGDKTTQKRRFTVQVVNTEKGLKNPEINWAVTITDNETSLYGQLINLGARRGKLEGETFVLLAKGEGTARNYTIPELLDKPKEPEGSSNSSSRGGIE